jgi:hypothetical protein
MNGLRELLDSIRKSFIKKSEDMKSHISQKSAIFSTLKANALTFIVHYSRFVNIVKDKYKKIYNDYPLARSIVDYSSYWFSYTYSYVIRKKIEPLSSYWISTAVLSKRDKNRYVGEEYTLLESYEFMKTPYELMEKQMICESSYNETCDAVDSIVLNSSSYIEGMVKMKLGDNYIYRIFDNTNGFFKEFMMPMLSSKAKFLSIEYTHPIMKKNISIDLNKSIYFVDNQILSPTFVKLYLEYQPELYHFDMDYVLKIMDGDINTFEIGFDKSILLTADGYKII